jgi:cytochrome c-type biogenesis protein CcmH/NrfF
MLSVQAGDGPAPFPVTDWEFWVATVIVVVLVGLGIWRVLPRRWKRRGRSSRATLTVEGKAVTKSSR